MISVNRRDSGIRTLILLRSGGTNYVPDNDGAQLATGWRVPFLKQAHPIYRIDLPCGEWFW